MSLPIVDASRIRALVGFEDLIEPVSRAFQDFSAGLAQSAMVTMFPAPDPTLGDVYVKTGCIRRHSHYLVKISPLRLCLIPVVRKPARHLYEVMRLSPTAISLHVLVT